MDSSSLRPLPVHRPRPRPRPHAPASTSAGLVDASRPRVRVGEDFARVLILISRPSVVAPATSSTSSPSSAFHPHARLSDPAPAPRQRGIIYLTLPEGCKGPAS
ncbi:hypothetical protein EJ04DRAFT_140969 [Polyplosphaeria fusca]|uniref:Uncharacterized protein n=1 Tax=Polyplosphaeria fusca TaxID=682080 RepID=A0A9P4UUL3_9PLEO|nr:hypothetical protein EJ04DRAFT_140969 [Polyplosphaeria fusca]